MEDRPPSRLPSTLLVACATLAVASLLMASRDVASAALMWLQELGAELPSLTLFTMGPASRMSGVVPLAVLVVGLAACVACLRAHPRQLDLIRALSLCAALLALTWTALVLWGAALPFTPLHAWTHH